MTQLNEFKIIQTLPDFTGMTKQFLFELSKTAQKWNNFNIFRMGTPQNLKHCQKRGEISILMTFFDRKIRFVVQMMD